MRRTLLAIVAVIVLVIGLEWLGLLGWRGDDRRHYQGKWFAVAGILDGQTLLLQEADGRLTPLHLLGIDAPMGDSPFAQSAAEALLEKTWKKNVLIRFDPMATRDAAGGLTAYVYLSDADMVNTDMVKSGAAYAQRKLRCEMTTAFTLAESDAHKHSRGLWQGQSAATQRR